MTPFDIVCPLYFNLILWDNGSMNKKQMKFSQMIDKHLRVPTEEDYRKMENDYITKRLLGKRQYGMKKLMKALYEKD